MRNDCVLKGRLWTDKRYTPFTFVHFGAICPALELECHQASRRSKVNMSMAVYGESRRRRGSEIEKKSIQVSFELVIRKWKKWEQATNVRDK